MKKAYKTLGIVAVGGVLAFVVLVLGIVFFMRSNAYEDYLLVKATVAAYVEHHYGKDATLVKSRASDDYPATSVHRFVFYDADHKWYFKVYGSRDDIFDYYENGSEQVEDISID